MTDRQENKLSMYTKVSKFLSEKTADLAAYPVVATFKTKLDNKINEIVLAEAIAGADNTGHAQVKAQAQADLLAKTLKVGSATAMYYTVTVPNAALREKVDYLRSELERMRDSDKYIASKRVLDVADPVKALLGDFGVVAADVDALATARQTFYAVIQTPKEKFAEAVAAGKTVDRLMAETDVILNEELDTQMQIVSVDDPDLYEIYAIARLIDDTGSQGGGSDAPFADNGTVGAGMVAFIDTQGVAIDANTPIVFKNNGAPQLQYYFEATVNSYPNPGTPVTTVNSGGTVEVTAGAAGFDVSRQKLHVSCTGPGTGAWSVEIG